MKSIMLICFVCVITVVNSQNFEPTQYRFNWGTNGPFIYLSSDSAYFQQDKILLGWHWGGSRKISHAERMNQFDSPRDWNAYGITINSLDSNCNIIMKPNEYSHAVDNQRLNARGIQYEPTLLLEYNNHEKLITRIGDTTRPVFGFLNRRGRILDDSTNQNFNRLIIDGDSLINEIILSEPWPSNQLSMAGASLNHNTLGEHTIDTFLCRLMYVSINLRRTDNEMNDNSVLKIELPYTITGGTTNNIRFDSIPSNISTETYNLSNSRGMIRRLIGAPDNNTRAIYISKNMIPPNNEDITISAFFRCDNDTTPPFPLPDPRPWGNHVLKEYSPTLNCIDSLKIKITYLGGSPLMIDWVRIETVHTQRYLRGAFDQDLINHTQEDLNKFISNDYTSRGIKLFRYNTVIEGSLFNWISEKYFNKLIGNIGTSEVGVIYPAHYEQYVNPPDRWFGTYQTASNVSAPYSQKVYEFTNNDRAKTMGIFNGYTGRDNALIVNDSTKSHYETYVVNKYTPIAINYFLIHPDSMNLYAQVINPSNNDGRSSYLTNYEGTLFASYFNDKARSFLFSNKFWWNQGFILQSWGDIVDINLWDNNRIKKDTFSVFGIRPITGEELRLNATLGMLLGAKGLLYDGPETGAGDLSFSRIYDSGCIPTLTRTNLEAQTDSVFLNSDIAGPDFIRTSGEILNLNNRLANLDSIAKYMDRPRDKIYIGRKSLRLEMQKIHEWIRANDSTLMNLRLASWFAKGYKKWYIQDTARFGQDTILNKFVNTDSNYLKVRPINRVKWVYQQAPLEPYLVDFYESYDSLFFDLTILRDKSDNNLTGNTWYLGVQNRRTSPLIFYQDTLETNSSYKFYTTFEFDTLARFGGRTMNGKYHDSTWWREKYWSRAGVREIHIPFNYIPQDTTEYCLLRVTELGVGTALDASPNYWWFRAPFKFRVDTIIGQNRSIVLNMLPGEGKLLKIDVLHPGTATGFLSHSNQSKLICYPKGNSQDSVIYHLTYFKLRPGTQINGVYYRKSKAFKKDDPKENIEWEPEICLSDSIQKLDLTYTNSKPCDYPSIVVRTDNDTTKVYVVYSCLGDVTGPNSWIVENIIRLQGNTFTHLVQDKIGKAISGYYGTNREVWGTPSINASYGGNYYVWSDSTWWCQIVAAWKAPNDRAFQNENRDSIIRFYWGFNVPVSNLLHPSLNVYSNITQGEDNCALVFQGRLQEWGTFYPPPYPMDNDQIFYTRIRKLQNKVVHYLPETFSDPNFRVDTLHRLARLSDFLDNHNRNEEFQINNSFPIVYRDLTMRNLRTLTPNPKRLDRIYWQSTAQGGGTSRIYKRGVNLWDTSNVAVKYNVLPPTLMRSYGYSCTQVNVNNGQIISNNGEIDRNNLCLNFTAKTSNDLLWNSRIWQLPDFLSSSLSIDTVKLFASRMQTMYLGRLSHLSQRNMSDNDKIWINRRVYETDTTTPPRILSSAKYFYRTLADNEIESDGLTGFTNDSTYYYINLPKLNSNDLQMYLPYTIVYDSSDYNFVPNNRDTLYSEWFKVNNSADIEFKCLGFDSSRVSVKIHQQSTNNLTPLTIPLITTDSTGILRMYTLVNGQGLYYRLEFTKRDTTAHYSEQIFINGLPVSDTMLGRTTYDKREIIDLHSQYGNNDNSGISLSIFPNPADNNVYATAYLPLTAFIGKSQHQMILKVFSSLGFELFRQEVKSGETISIPTKDYPQGAYFIRAEEKTDHTIDVIPAQVQGFVIKR